MIFWANSRNLGAGAEGRCAGHRRLVGPEQVLINGEAGEPTDFRFHRDAWREHGNRCATAKREAGEIFLANRGTSRWSVNVDARQPKTRSATVRPNPDGWRGDGHGVGTGRDRRC